ncbi:MAG: OmpA family protein [Bdellovibrionales bacterium]|nr:OmpA family protein [Oligoflexia bacterium]
MMNKSWLLWGVAFCIATQMKALAAPQAIRKLASPTSTQPLSHAGESPWTLFAGLDLGFSNFSPYNDSLTEAARSGSHIGPRLLIAHYTEKWVLDGGLGYQFIINRGTNSDRSVNTANTRNVYADFSARYRIGEHWQLGPEFQYWLGTDKGLNPTIPGSDTISELSNTSAWGGIQAVYEWMDTNKLRVGGRILTDLNVEGRTVNIFQVFFQFGFNFFGGPNASPRPKNVEQINENDLDRGSRYDAAPLPMITPEPAQTPWPDPVVMSTPSDPEPTPSPTPKATPEPVVIKKAPKVILTLDVNDLPFGYNDAKLPAANSARVRKIGAFLKKNNGSWKRVTVAGHTDERGSKAYNLNLAKRRADTVKKLLGEGGAPLSKIRAVGMGEDYPLNKGHNEAAWAKNRRVELEFQDVKDVVLIRKAMDK